MKKIFSFIIIGIMVFSLTACANRTKDNFTRQEPADRQEISEKESDSGMDTVPAEGTVPVDSAKQEETDMDSNSSTEKNILVAYFSLAGEQYGVGVIEEGNTSVIANMIADQTGAICLRLKP